ncbi:hypothetical protein V6N12_006069 [Hibiscus sabdariffa]|uniref:Uncharacterized protein n=1 Tax=Hibiscus sabdariffa TaxID=183260 RepID=A0ABR2EWW8_9ROSI
MSRLYVSLDPTVEMKSMKEEPRSASKLRNLSTTWILQLMLAHDLRQPSTSSLKAASEVNGLRRQDTTLIQSDSKTMFVSFHLRELVPAYFKTTAWRRCVIMREVTWNVRGLGTEVKISTIKKLVWEYKMDMIFIQESKKQTVSVEEVWKMWIDDDFDYRMVAADWRSEGLITIILRAI